MRKPKLYLDLDDVVLKTTEFKNKVRKELLSSKDNVFVNSTNDMREVILYSQLLSRYTEVLVDDVYLANKDKLSSLYDINYISMYSTKDEKEFKKNLSKEHGVSFVGVSTRRHKDKSHIDMSDSDCIFVDDNITYLKTSNCSNKIFYGRITEYLLSRGISLGITHANNWDKLVDILLKGD